MNIRSSPMAGANAKTMEPQKDIERLQIEAYRRMTGEERLRIGLGLFEASLDIARAGIRDQFPDATDEEVEEKLRERIRTGYEIEAQSRKSFS